MLYRFATRGNRTTIPASRFWHPFRPSRPAVRAFAPPPSSWDLSTRSMWTARAFPVRRARGASPRSRPRAIDAPPTLLERQVLACHPSRSLPATSTPSRPARRSSAAANWSPFATPSAGSPTTASSARPPASTWRPSTRSVRPGGSGRSSPMAAGHSRSE